MIPNSGNDDSTKSTQKNNPFLRSEIADPCSNRNDSNVAVRLGQTNTSYIVQRVWSEVSKKCIYESKNAAVALTVSHGLCMRGEGVGNVTDPCGVSVVTMRPSCATSAWDDECISLIQNLCGFTCVSNLENYLLILFLIQINYCFLSLWVMK
jgi:hypothetical protein